MFRETHVDCNRACTLVGITCDDNFGIRVCFEVVGNFFNFCHFGFRNLSLGDSEEDVAAERLFLGFRSHFHCLFYNAFNNYSVVNCLCLVDNRDFNCLGNFLSCFAKSNLHTCKSVEIPVGILCFF